MKRIVLSAVAAALCLAPACAREAGGVPPDTLHISGIRAHLFENRTGRLTDDVLAPGAPALWNTIAGPGASNATLVVVELSGEPGSTHTGQPGSGALVRVRLLATEPSAAAPLLDQAQVVPAFGEDGAAFAAFLLYPGGCDPVTLSATLEGHSSPPVERSLDFACGE